jgi:hypothetical protein
MRAYVVLPLLLVACKDSGILAERDVPTLTLRLDSPTYGQFAGAGAIHVTGEVQPPNALLRIEGRTVVPHADGTFDVPVPFFKPYRIIEVTADGYEQHAEARVPVFRGTDPLLSWPGAVTLRVTANGLDGLEGVIEAAVGDLLSQSLGQLGQQIPITGGIVLGIDGLDLGDLNVDLSTADDAVVAAFVAKDVALHASISGDLFGNPFTVPATLTFPRVGLTADLSVDVDATGQLLAGFSSPKIKLDLPEVAIAGADFAWLADLLSNVVDLQSILQGFVDQALGQGAQLPLAGPIAFDTNLLGTRLSLALTDASTDRLGVGLGLGLGLGGPVPATAASVPLPDGDFDPPVDLAVAAHDGLLQVLLKSSLLSLLEQDLVLPGFLGGFFEPMVSNLPGGDQIPPHDGWCIGIHPGDARVARFGGGGDAPFAGIYLPDAQVTFSIVDPMNAGACTPWLETSLALEVLLDVHDGTVIGLDVEVPEGVVLSYGAEGADEDAVVAQLGGLIQNLLGLLGGFTQLDLKDLLGGLGDQAGLGGLLGDLAIRDQKPMLGHDGQPIDGMVEIGVQLFPSAAP